jgi:DNA-binding NarL/FixJ family response regulator
MAPSCSRRGRPLRPHSASEILEPATKFMTDGDEKAIIRLHRKGWTQHEIAKLLGLTQTLVAYVIDRRKESHGYKP